MKQPLPTLALYFVVYTRLDPIYLLLAKYCQVIKTSVENKRKLASLNG